MRGVGDGDGLTFAGGRAVGLAAGVGVELGVNDGDGLGVGLGFGVGVGVRMFVFKFVPILKSVLKLALVLKLKFESKPRFVLRLTFWFKRFALMFILTFAGASFWRNQNSTPPNPNTAKVPKIVRTTVFAVLGGGGGGG